MSIIAFLIVGLIAGLIARAILPGRQSMGLVATTLLGCAGSFVGGLVGGLISGRGFAELHPSGIIFSVIGAIVLLLLVGMASGRRHGRAHV